MKYGCHNLTRDVEDRIVPIKLYDAKGNYLGEGTERIKPVMSVLCRNIGQYFNDEWHEDKECEGCNPINKDHKWIAEMRRAYEREVRSYRMRC